MADAISTADSGTGGTDWNAALGGVESAMGKPVASNPTAFANFYGPVADHVSQKTGIDSNTILGQWGLETGWGKSVIPGTNNLGNIKSTAASGPGVAATDNQLGTSDQYQKFASPSDFADAYTNLLTNKYAGALNTGTDAHATATALKAGGYAQDPDYVSKLTNATSTVAQARGQAPNLTAQGSSGPIGTAGAADWGAALDRALPALKQGATSDTTGGLGFVPMSQFEAQYGVGQNGNNPAGGNPDPNAFVALGAGLGRGLQSAALGAQALVGKGAQALGADSVGNWLVNDAQAGNAAGGQQFANAAGDSLSGKVGQVIGSSVPAVFAGPEVLPQALMGAAYGGGNAALNNESIGRGAVEGAGMGAAGAALGQAVGAGVQAAKPLLTGAINRVTGGQDAAVSSIAKQLGDQLNPTIDALNANSNEIIPGSLPTAAEAGNSPALVKLQRQLQNTSAGQEAFPARAAANNDARVAAGQNAVGPSANNSQLMGPGLEQETDAFTQAQAQRIAQGQTELPPISQAQADLMQTPAYARAINQARNDAQSAGNSAFTDQASAVNADLANQIDQVAGTPQTLEAAQAARRAQGAVDYAGVTGPVSADTPAFADLQARPGFNTALRRASGIEDNMNGSAAADPLTTQPGTRTFEVQPDGTLGFTEGPPQRFADAGVLQGARSQLSGMAQAAGQAGDAAAAKGYRDTLSALDNFLGSEEHVGPDIANSFNTARANYAANSVPIDQQQFLQSKLTPAVNNLTGEVNPTTLNSTINAVQRGQLKPGLRPEDRITLQQTATLQNIGQQAQAAPTNMVGLNGQGQEALRQALAARAAKSVPEAAVSDAFNQHLAANSPAYAQAQNVANGYGADLASRQSLAEALAKLGTAAHNATGEPQINFSSAKSALNQAGPLRGVQQEYASNLLADLQRATAANAPLGAAGSQTAANLNLGGGLFGDLIGHKINNATIGTALATGHIGGAAIGAIAQKILGNAGVKTEQAAINLLLNPKQLAAALEKFQNQPNAAQVFFDALKNKAAQGGRAGIAAVQAYEAASH